jgi:hypothetical protein
VLNLPLRAIFYARDMTLPAILHPVPAVLDQAPVYDPVTFKFSFWAGEYTPCERLPLFLE